MACDSSATASGRPATLARPTAPSHACASSLFSFLLLLQNISQHTNARSPNALFFSRKLCSLKIRMSSSTHNAVAFFMRAAWRPGHARCAHKGCCSALARCCVGDPPRRIPTRRPPLTAPAHIAQARLCLPIFFVGDGVPKHKYRAACCTAALFVCLCQNVSNLLPSCHAAVSFPLSAPLLVSTRLSPHLWLPDCVPLPLWRLSTSLVSCEGVKSDLAVVVLMYCRRVVDLCAGRKVVKKRKAAPAALCSLECHKKKKKEVEVDDGVE